MSKCLYCYGELEDGQTHFHPSCAHKFFGTAVVPVLPYTRDNMSDLARQVIRTSATVTGVQAKMSLDLDRGKKNEPARFTIVGLWGRYIFKPQSSKYRCLPELEDLTMKMASAAGIRTVEHTLIPMADGELGYLTKRIDRNSKGGKISMLDMCQLSNRLTEHKYYGTYPQLADTIKHYSSAPLLDVQRFWEVVLFSWITGNSDMHCKNFSLIDMGGRKYTLAPAFDLLAVLLADPEDQEELAMTFTVGGRKDGFDRESFLVAMEESGISRPVAEKKIVRMCNSLPVWESLIDKSFLPDDLKSSYKNLIQERLTRLL
ncbi:MAG: HipA domain-containing protein [Bacteroidales bacterium]|nr:HipA domain-containing protein [Bacteroidales bacterium]